MLAEDRLNAIVSMVQQMGSVTVPELAEALGVTASTIRRDLQTLNRAHRIAKVHGGATSLERAHVTRDLRNVSAPVRRRWWSPRALCTSTRARRRSGSSSIFHTLKVSPM